MSGIPFPSTQLAVIAAFVTFAHSQLHLRTSTLHVYLSGLNFFMKLICGSPCLAITHPQISMLIRGLQRTEAPATPSRHPLTSDLLLKCLLTLRSGYLSPLIDLTLESMFLLAFYGFLRCAEFTSSTSQYSPSRHPSLCDITFHSSESLTFTLKHSKTDQIGRTSTIHLFKTDSPLCPYGPILRYVSLRRSLNAAPRDPLFITETGSIATRFWFHHHFRQILSLSGLPPQLYSGHSFRIGAASTAARQGLSDHIIKILGRWSSQAYHSYIRSNIRDIHNAHHLLGRT